MTGALEKKNIAMKTIYGAKLLDTYKIKATVAKTIKLLTCFYKNSHQVERVHSILVKITFRSRTKSNKTNMQ